jgi:5'(3')-deoxyribonucleotidase
MTRGRKPKQKITPAEERVEQKMETPIEVFDAANANVIAVDLDGVLANSHKLILRLLGKPADINLINSWEYLSEFGNKFWEAYETAWMNFEDIEPTDDTLADTFKTLQTIGVTCDVVTSRFANLRDVTEKWLRRNGIIYRNLIILPHTQADKSITGHKLYVDDNPVFAELHPDIVILYDRPWNKHVNGVRRIHLFEDLIDVLVDISDKEDKW